MFFGSRAQDGQKQARFFYPRRGGIETSRVLTSGQANTLHILRQLQQQFQEQDRALTDTFKHVQFRDKFFRKTLRAPRPSIALVRASSPEDAHTDHGHHHEKCASLRIASCGSMPVRIALRRLPCQRESGTHGTAHVCVCARCCILRPSLGNPRILNPL